MNAFTMIACFPIFPGASLSLQLGRNFWEIAKDSTFLTFQEIFLGFFYSIESLENICHNIVKDYEFK